MSAALRTVAVLLILCFFAGLMSMMLDLAGFRVWGEHSRQMITLLYLGPWACGVTAGVAVAVWAIITRKLP